MISGKNLKYKIILFMLTISVTAPALAEQPDDLYREGKFSEAEKAYTKADMDNPRDIRYRYNRGCAAFQNKNPGYSNHL